MKIRVIRRRHLRGDAPSLHSEAIERPRKPARAVSPRAREQVTRLVVDVGNRASAWRAAASDAELAYRWWQTAPMGERDDAAAVYLAAIEREEKAAAEYGHALEACRTTAL